MSVINLQATIELSVLTEIQQRVRYNFWDLLGDVGGFNDGLILLFSIFMGTYSAFSYSLDLLAEMHVDTAPKQLKMPR